MTQESAKDWISNLNDIINKYEQWYQSSNSTWQEFLETNKQEWQDFVHANREIIEAIDPNGKLLEEIIDSRNSKIYGQFAALKDRLDNVENMTNKKVMNTSTNLSVGLLPDDDTLSVLSAIKSGIDDSKFNLGMITDVHYGNWADHTGRNNPDTINHLNNILYLDDKLDATISGGDNCDGSSLSRLALINEQRTYAEAFLFSLSDVSDKFIVLGNHDDGSFRCVGEQSGNYHYLHLISGENGFTMSTPAPLFRKDFKTLYHTPELLFGESRNNGENYFFKDYPNKKIRLIGLNSCDVPETVGTDGLPDYPQINNMGYQQAQIDWFANVALQNVPTDYVTLVVSHIPANYDVSQQHNQTIINQIIKSFMDGTDVSLSSTDADFAVNVSTNFSAQGTRDFGAYLHGHLHKETFENDEGFNAIGITSSICDPTIGTSDGWDVITVDKDNREIVLTGFGRATNRSYAY